MSRIRLIASDLDGTVLSHRFEISERTVEAFGAVRDAGYEVVFVTGRPPWFMSPLRTYMSAAGHAVGTVIGSNGAVVYDLDADEVLGTEFLAVETALECMESIRRAVPQAAFAVETLAGPVAEPAYVPGDTHRFEVVEDLLTVLRERSGELDGVLKLHARDPESDDADALSAVVASAVPPSVSVTHSIPGYAWVEISRDGVNKANTLAEYAHSRGIRPEEVIAFGDMPNDLTMLEWAGVGFAMASGHPTVVETADRVAPAFAEDGVAQILEELLRTGEVPAGIERPSRA